MTDDQARTRAERFVRDTDGSPEAFRRMRLTGIERHKVAHWAAYLLSRHPPVCAPGYGGR